MTPLAVAMPAAAKITAAAFSASTITTVLLELAGRDSRDQHGLQDMAMPSLAATLALSPGGRTKHAATIALLASTAGDMSGSMPEKVGWFSAAHVAYIAAFARGKHRRWWIVAPVIIGAGTWATAHAAGLRPACTIYACLVAAMTVAASSYSRLAGASALLFALSDFLIACGLWRSKKQPAWGRALMLATYLLAQAGLTKAVVDGEAS